MLLFQVKNGFHMLTLEHCKMASDFDTSDVQVKPGTSVVYGILGSPVAKWVKRWPTDRAVPSSSSARGEISSIVNGPVFHYT